MHTCASQPASTTTAELAFAIDQALPQTQCTRCGYPDCATYAQAIAQGQAGINQCPPGGQEGIERLAAITGQPVQPLHPQFGIEGPLTVARIDESWCIGCTLCLKACPTDAILGANKYMHTVIADHCTGCELCLPVCPVDCIHLDVVDPNKSGWQAWSLQQAEHSRNRYMAHQQRQSCRLERAAEPVPQRPASLHVAAVADPKKAAIAAALAKARALRER